MKRYLLSALTLSLMTAFAGAADTAPVSGIDTQYIDASVRPQDDFYRYLNGGWLKTTQIPEDKSSWGTFAKLRDDVLPQLRAIIEAAEADKTRKAGSDAQKIGDLYASFMDEKKLDSLGVKPLVFVGEASYCLYLLHFNLWNIVHDSGILTRLGLAKFDPWLSYALMVVMALAALHFIEKPAQRVLRGWMHVWR